MSGIIITLWMNVVWAGLTWIIPDALEIDVFLRRPSQSTMDSKEAAVSGETDIRS